MARSGAGLQRQGMDRQRGGGNLGANAGLAAEVSEIGGEAVAEVDRGGRKADGAAAPAPRRSAAAGSICGWAASRGVHRAERDSGRPGLRSRPRAAPCRQARRPHRPVRRSRRVRRRRVLRCAAVRAPPGQTPPAQCPPAPARRAIRWCRRPPAARRIAPPGCAGR